MSPSVQKCYEEFVKISPAANKTLIKENTSSKSTNFGTKLKGDKESNSKTIRKFKPNAEKQKSIIKNFFTKPVTSKLQTKNMKRKW